RRQPGKLFPGPVDEKDAPLPAEKEKRLACTLEKGLPAKLGGRVSAFRSRSPVGAKFRMRRVGHGGRTDAAENQRMDAKSVKTRAIHTRKPVMRRPHRKAS